MDQDREARAVGRGEVLVLIQRSVRRREYELRRGDEVTGWLRFAAGRRSVAAVGAGATGSLTLTAARMVSRSAAARTAPPCSPSSSEAPGGRT